MDLTFIYEKWAQHTLTKQNVQSKFLFVVSQQKRKNCKKSESNIDTSFHIVWLLLNLLQNRLKPAENKNKMLNIVKKIVQSF